jgi:signal transduction histidine kinase
LNVPDVLDSLRRRASRRFPMEVVPSGSLFPVLEMDRQLLRYIYRNAVSNACKYGKKEGVVSTRVSYDRGLQMLTMQVINLPGVGHEKLCQLSAAEAARVFEQDYQLKETQQASGVEAEAIRNESSGNGAWIMKKVSYDERLLNLLILVC